MATDPIAVLEAAYSLEGAENAWLERVLTAAHPLLDRGFGTAGFFFTLDRRGDLRVTLPVTRHLLVPAEAIRRVNHAAPRETIARLYLTAPPCATAATLVGQSMRREAGAKRI